MTTEQAVNILGPPPQPGSPYDEGLGTPVGFVDTQSNKWRGQDRTKMSFLFNLNDNHKLYDGVRFWKISPAALKIWEKVEDKNALIQTLKLLRQLNK
jgi:hypothetical protein